MFVTLRRWLGGSDAENIFDPVDWSAVQGYGELVSLCRRGPPLSGDAFLDGPFDRFLHLATDPAASRGVRARTLQFAHACAQEQRSRLSDDGEIDVYDRKLQEALAELQTSEDHRWLIDVWEGRVGHHGV